MSWLEVLGRVEAGQSQATAPMGAPGDLSGIAQSCVRLRKHGRASLALRAQDARLVVRGARDAASDAEQQRPTGAPTGEPSRREPPRGHSLTWRMKALVGSLSTKNGRTPPRPSPLARRGPERPGPGAITRRT